MIPLITLYALGLFTYINNNHWNDLCGGVTGLNLHYREQPSNSAENEFEEDEVDLKETS